MQKCWELNSEIVANLAKVSTAFPLSQEDQATIASLKKEIEKAWKMVDAAHEKEIRARETIHSLKLEIANLSKLVEQGAEHTVAQEHRDQERALAQAGALIIQPQLTNGPQFTGGGFNLKATKTVA